MHYKVKYFCKIRINTANNNFCNFVYCVMGNVFRNVARDIKLPQKHKSKIHTLKT